MVQQKRNHILLFFQIKLADALRSFVVSAVVPVKLLRLTKGVVRLSVQLV